jgi:hypothetical protein
LIQLTVQGEALVVTHGTSRSDNTSKQPVGFARVNEGDVGAGALAEKEGAVIPGGRRAVDASSVCLTLASWTHCTVRRGIKLRYLMSKAFTNLKLLVSCCVLGTGVCLLTARIACFPLFFFKIWKSSSSR